VQDVHVVELENEFQPNRAIAMGAASWLTIKRYEDDAGRRGLSQAAHTLKEQGYHLVAMTLHEESIPIAELSLQQPLALCFGTEEEGLTEEVHAVADSYVHLPMYGFTQSFNISVTVALSLQALTRRLHNSDLNWRLSPQEQRQLKLKWLVNSVPRGEIVLREHARSLGIEMTG
jgi:tRNA (guanosine-2'-O-)-methyltransferase